MIVLFLIKMPANPKIPPAINPLENPDKRAVPDIHHCGVGCKICKPIRSNK